MDEKFIIKKYLSPWLIAKTRNLEMMLQVLMLQMKNISYQIKIV